MDVGGRKRGEGVGKPEASELMAAAPSVSETLARRKPMKMPAGVAKANRQMTVQ